MVDMIRLADDMILIELHTEEGHHIVEVTRPTIFGKVNSHVISSQYPMGEIADYLVLRSTPRGRMVQDAFPEMKKEDREFLISGITPAEWAAITAHEEDPE